MKINHVLSARAAVKGTLCAACESLCSKSTPRTQVTGGKTVLMSIRFIPMVWKPRIVIRTPRVS